jgi:hypothetical protein
MARLIKVSYAGLTLGLGGDASITLTDKYTCAYGYTEFNFTATVVVRSATRSTFLAAEAALIAAFRAPDQDLDVELGGTNRHSFAAASGTGFNSRATCEKLGREEDTANSARYRISVTVQLPADLSGRSGRQTSMVSVDAGPNGARTVTIEGTYTAVSGTPTATAVYVSAGTTYCDAVITAVGGTYELLTPVNSGSGIAAAAGFKYDDQNRVLSFRRVYQEVIYRQSLSETDNAAIKRPNLSIERLIPTDDSSSEFNSRPLDRLRVNYSAEIDKNSTTDLVALYTGTIRPLMLAEANLVAGGTVVVTSERYAPDRTGNGISAVMECAADAGAEFFRAVLTAEDFIRPGEEFAPVWSGDPYEVDLYKVPAVHIKTVIRDTVVREGTTIDPRRGIPAFPGFREIEQQRRETRTAEGITGDQIPLEAVTHTFVFRKVNISSTSTSGGGLVSQVRTTPPLGFNS